MPPPFRLTNTLSRQVETVEPAAFTDAGQPLLRFYSCGPTVYSYAHIGNFRTFLTADLVVRPGEALGGAVRDVSNGTGGGPLTEAGVGGAGGEDKMQKALQSKEGAAFANVWDLARHYTDALLRDWRALGLRDPDVRPRATEHVREQIRAVERLIESGHAYETEDGVYFHVPSFPAYGQLSGNTDAEALVVDARGTVQDGGKRDPRDFALWKKDDAHLMQWFSPFESGPAGGWGFPGWHLECSVMAQKYLGDTIDLHGGGEDLRFPHHECEIAQAEALSGQTFSRYWIHTRFLQVEGEKMSKSRGNFLTLHDLMATPEDGGRAEWGAPVDPLALRLVLISGHYARPFNLTRKALDDARKNVRRYAEALQAAEAAQGDGPDVLADVLSAAGDEMLAAMADDLNTPLALAAAYRGASAIRNIGAHSPSLSAASGASALAFLDRVQALLGIVRAEIPVEAEDAGADPLAAEVETLLAQRAEARAAKDWPRADAIRAAIDALGVVVMDTPAGPTWTRRDA